ncbi:MAG: response regulator [Deltaproteobacteria bacterium]|nr:response regulator [Deltaproteobacteria bacterium]
MTKQANGRTVLVVEDNEDVRSVLTIYLQRNGYQVSEAGDGLTAVDMALKLQPDVILLDVLLPRLDGIEVLKRLRKAKPGADLPVIMMSAVLQTRDLQSETAALNVASFLQKPFQVQKVLEYVEGAISQKGTALAARTVTPAAAQNEIEEKKVRHERRPREASGTLDSFPVPELLHSLYVESSTGSLLICSGTTEKRVYFQNGWPVYSESSIPEETLGAHLMRQGRLTKEQHQRALDEMTLSGRQFGEVLLKLGLLGPHDLFTELEAHLTAKVISTFGWFEGTFHFEAGSSWKDDIIVARMKPGRIILDGIQGYWSPERIQRRVHIVDSSRVFSMDGSPYAEDQLGLSTQEARILQMVRRGFTVGEITRQVGDIKLVGGTLFGLFVMEHVGFILNPKTMVSQLAADASPARADKPTSHVKHEEHAKALMAEYLKYRTADYFKLLGVSRDASVDEITQAFKVRQRRYHPDTLVGIDTGLVHEKIEELYIRLHTAYRTLVDPTAREQYVKKLDEAEPAAATARVLPARPAQKGNKEEDVVLFEDGFALLRCGEFKNAHELLKRAEEISPKPQYTGYRAWAAYLADPIVENAKTERTLVGLRKDNSNDALFPYLLGNFYLREKDAKRAVSYFEEALRINPQHIDSARQLRILRMRQRSTEASGLFDLFSKK